MELLQLSPEQIEEALESVAEYKGASKGPLEHMSYIPSNILDSGGCRIYRCDFDGDFSHPQISPNSKIAKDAQLNAARAIILQREVDELKAERARIWEEGRNAAANEHTKISSDFSELAVKAMNRVGGLMPGMYDDFIRTAKNHRDHAGHIRSIPNPYKKEE